jgi:hypothetical protein
VTLQEDLPSFWHWLFGFVEDKGAI